MEDLKLIKVGRVANDGTGDDLRTASQTTNANLAKVRAAIRDTQEAARLALTTAQSASAGFLDREAAVDIPASTVVVGFNDLIRPADPANPAHRGLVLGVVRDPVPAGTRVVVQQFGTLEGVTGAFGQGQRLFIGANGSLTATAPVSGWRQAIGSAISTSSVLLSLGPAYAIRPTGQLLVAPGDEVIAAIVLAALTPSLLQAALLALGRSLPFLPEGGTIPSDAGIYRRGNSEIYDLVVVEAQS